MSLLVEDDHPSREIPLSVFALILVNAALFFPFALSEDPRLIRFGLPSLDGMIDSYGFRPSNLRPETLFLSLFLHVDFWHLFGNMYFLYLFGDNVEDVLGSFLFLLSYIICGFSGLLLHNLIYQGSDIPVIGASGAVSGVAGLYIMMFPHVKLKFVRIFSFERYEPFKISAFALILIWFILSTFIGTYPLLAHQAQRSHIAHFGHIGGLVSGILLSLIFIKLGFLRGIEDYAERGSHDMESLAPAAGGPLGDAENVTGAFAWELLFGFWYLLFHKNFRDRRVRFWRKQCRSLIGALLVLVEIIFLVAVGVGLIFALSLVAIDPAFRKVLFDLGNNVLR